MEENKMSDKYYDENGNEINVKRTTRSKISRKISAITPILATAAFFYLGLFENMWHPGWVVFTVIPLVEILLTIYTQEGKAKWVSISVILSIIGYIVLGVLTGEWWKVWLVFFIVPVVAIIAE